jgi:glycosyltransferase involved in cell wall biosynthesis
MRILALTTLYPNPYQPHRATFNRLQFRALAAEHEVQVIAPIAWTGEWSARHGRAGTPPRLEADRRRFCDGMVVQHPRYIFTPKVLRGWYGWFLVQSVRGCFLEAVAGFRPDVVLGCWAYPDGWAAVQLARQAGLPVAIKVHGSDVLTVGDHPARRRRTIEALTTADAVIAVSRHLGEQAIAMGAEPARVHTVYNGIDASVFHPASRESARRHLGITSGDPLILFVGNLVPVKGLDVLLDGLASLASAGLRFQAALVGEGPLREELQSRIEAFGLSGRVRLVGPRPQEQLPFWYRSAELLVLPSRSEGVPNVLLEATACGTPWIASRVGGIAEIANPDALVPRGDAAALAERIRAFLGGLGRPVATPAFRPSSWNDSARALSAVLRGIVIDAPGRVSLGA